MAALGFMSDASAAEFSGEEILPKIDSLTFLQDAIIVRTRAPSPAYFPEHDRFPHFLLNRESLLATPLTKDDADKLTDGYVPRPTNRLSIYENRMRSTSEGLAYQVNSGKCEENQYGQLEWKIKIGSDEIATPISACASFNEIESSQEYLWIGTFTAGGHGDYGAEGLIVVDRAVGYRVSAIDTGTLAISSVVRDPISGEIWAITDNRITIVSDNLGHQHNFAFYHDFNDGTGLPEVRLEAGRHYYNPLAIVARNLPTQQQPEFYRQIKSIPNSVVSLFRLYDFYMCCSYTYLDYGNKPLPGEFNVLIPFLQTGAANSRYGGEDKPGIWRQLACKLDHAEAKRLCATEDWRDYRSE